MNMTAITSLCLAVMMTAAASAGAQTLSITPQQVERLGIRTAPVSQAEEQTVTSILGTVTPAVNARLQVSAPFAGTVAAYHALEGETVEAGDTLAVIASRDLRESLADLQGLDAEFRAAKAAADRARQLVEEGIASRARAEEAIAREQQAEAALAAMQEIVSRADVLDGAKGEYRLLAPAEGRIAGIALSPGAHVEEMAPVLTLDTGDALWIEARLPAAMVGKISAGDAVVVEGQGVRGEVVAVGATIDPMTRSAVLRAAIPADAPLVAGQTVRISVLQSAPSGAFNLSRNAVVQLGDSVVVFLARDGGFEPVPVTVLARGASVATITGPIDASSIVAVSGLSELKTLALQD